MVGRAGAGALATVHNVSILHLNNMSLLVTGLSTGLVTVLCTSYASMLVYAVVYGLSVGMSSSSSFISPSSTKQQLQISTHSEQDSKALLANNCP